MTRMRIVPLVLVSMIALSLGFARAEDGVPLPDPAGLLPQEDADYSGPVLQDQPVLRPTVDVDCLLRDGFACPEKTACPRGYYEDRQSGYCVRYNSCRESHPHNYYHYHGDGSRGYGEWHTAYHCHSYWGQSTST